MVCLHNNAIVARGILVTILHCGTPEPRLSAIYIISSVGTSLGKVARPCQGRKLLPALAWDGLGAGRADGLRIAWVQPADVHLLTAAAGAALTDRLTDRLLGRLDPHSESRMKQSINHTLFTPCLHRCKNDLGSLSGSQYGLWCGLQSRSCTRLHGTVIVQYNKAHHIFVHCSFSVTSQSS